MLDVFNEEAEILIKEGISNLYWYKTDLRRVWIAAGISGAVCDQIFAIRTDSGQLLTKRQLMEELYRRAHQFSDVTRLEISRGFVKCLVEHQHFSAASPDHKIHIAEDSARKLRQMIHEQESASAQRATIRQRMLQNAAESYESRLSALQTRFAAAQKVEGQERGYEFERIFSGLMRASNIPVVEPFRIVDEQIDGAIHYDSKYYLVELKWVKHRCNQAELSSLYLKAEGKMDARSIFIAMEGYSDEVKQSITRGKQLKMILLDGVHFMRVLSGTNTFQELLDHAISYAALRGEVFPPYTIGQ